MFRESISRLFSDSTLIFVYVMLSLPFSLLTNYHNIFAYCLMCITSIADVTISDGVRLTESYVSFWYLNTTVDGQQWSMFCQSSSVTSLTLSYTINTLRPRQNGRHFPDDSFKCIFLNENVWISIKISLKFVPKGPINNIPALFQIMAWCRPGDKPLSEPMMVSLLYASLCLNELTHWGLITFSAPSHCLN